MFQILPEGFITQTDQMVRYYARWILDYHGT